MSHSGSDLGRLIGPVAQLCLGDRNEQHSSKTENRYGTNGSMSVDLEKGTYFNFETGIGGGVLDLIKATKGLAGADAFAWMRDHGLDVDEPPLYRNGNGRASHAAPSPKHVATYDYVDEAGELLFQALRYEPKTFKQRRPDPHIKGQWDWKVRGVRQVPYRLPDIIEAIADERLVVIVEGEKDANNLAKWGIPATCNAGGVGKWRPELCDFFRGADVVVIPDNDPQAHHPDGSLRFHPDGRPVLPGQDHANEVARQLQGIAARVRYLELPNLPPKGDATNWIEAGGTPEKFYALADQAPDWAPLSPAAAQVSEPLRLVEARPLVQSSADFVQGFVPPDYLIEGILQRGFLYSLTGRTGSGKTAVVLLIAASVALQRNIGRHEVAKGRVLYFAGENPDDIRMRWIAMAHNMAFDLNEINVDFIPGTFKISALFARIKAEIAQRGEVVLVVVDTSAAYFEGDDENSNAQQGIHARRLRGLVDFPGRPCVIVNCHPPKNAGDDNNQPRGGGAFIAEVDGNLTCQKGDGGVVEFHWQGKFRGPDFPPITFQTKTITSDELRDTKGRQLPSVMATHLSEAALEEMAAAGLTRENQLLANISEDPDASLSDRAQKLGWLTRDGHPYKMLVKRVLERLETEKLVSIERGKATLTKKGKEALDG